MAKKNIKTHNFLLYQLPAKYRKPCSHIKYNYMIFSFYGKTGSISTIFHKFF